jgi:hypothetical protein
MNIYAGGCHCQKLRYTLYWPDKGPLPARRCACSYCTRFNGTWTSHSNARLDLNFSDTDETNYRFGTQTADFVFCRSCGVMLVAMCTLDGRLRAVVNVHTLDPVQGLAFETADSDFDGESVDQRLDRRLSRWIGDVRPGQS